MKIRKQKSKLKRQFKFPLATYFGENFFKTLGLWVQNIKGRSDKRHKHINRGLKTCGSFFKSQENLILLPVVF